MNSGIGAVQHSLGQALEDLHARIAEVVLGLDDEAFDWRPHPGLLTIRELVDRAAAEEHHWLSEAVVGVSRAEGGGPRTGGDQMSDHPLFRLGSVGQSSQLIVSTLEPGDWLSVRRVDGQPVTVSSCLVHILEELARTLGQIEVVAVLWRARRQ